MCKRWGGNQADVDMHMQTWQRRGRCQEQEKMLSPCLPLDHALEPATPESLNQGMGRALGTLRAMNDSWPF